MINETKVRFCQFVLRLTYTIVPIIAGIDKFFNYVTNWIIYVNPQAIDFVPVSNEQFMYGVGLIEIIAGIIVFINPRLGGYIITVWLGVIIINLLTMGQYYDIALRDAVMAVGAMILVWLTESIK